MARSTVRETLKRTEAAGLSWPLSDDLSDGALEACQPAQQTGPSAHRGAGLGFSPSRTEAQARHLLIAAIAAPNLVWQAQNGWPFAAHPAVLSGEIITYSPASFFLQEILYLNPVTAPVWIAWLLAFVFWPRFAPYRWVAVSWAILFSACVVARSRPIYIAPGYPLLMASGTGALDTWLPRLAKPLLEGAVLAAGSLIAPMFLPILPVETFIAYQRALGFVPNTGRNFALRDLPQYYTD